MTNRDQVIGLAQSWVEAYNARDYDRLKEIFADDFILNDIGLDLVLEGPQTFVDGIKDVAENAIPDRRFTPERIFAADDTAVIEGSWKGTVQIEKWGLPPGSVRSHRSCTLLDVRDGRIARMTDYTCPDH